MAQDSSGTTGQHRRHPSAPKGQFGAAHGVDTAKDRMQPPLRNPMMDGVLSEPQRAKLIPSHNPMLHLRHPPNPSSYAGRLLS
jgi:hypothetical protein